MNNQRNNNAQVDDDGRGTIQQPYHQRSRNFYRKRPGPKKKNFFPNFL
jgi:hypothetical protein